MSIGSRSKTARNAREAQSPSRIDRWCDLFCLFRLTGDNEYFAEILDGTLEEMQRHTRGVCRREGLGQDFVPVLLNEASMKLLRAAPKFDCKKPLLPYFKAIVTHCGRDRARSERRRRTESLSAPQFADGDSSCGSKSEPAAPASSNPAIEAESREAVERIRAAVASLPEPECRVMTAKISGSHRCEIAEWFGFRPEQVSRILHKARRLLREKLE